MSLRSVWVKDQRLHPVWRIVVFAVAVVISSNVLWALYQIARGRAQAPPSFLATEISSEFAAAISVVIVAYWLRRALDRRSVASLGLSPRGPWLRLFCIGVAFGVGMQAVTFGLEWALGMAHTVSVGSAQADARILGAAAPVFAAGAVLEELSFRGYLLQNFWEAFGALPAVLTTSVLFALFHLSNPNSSRNVIMILLGLLLFALWASFSVLWTRSLWLALGAHFAWNLVEGPVFGFPVSGLSMPVQTVLSQAVSGPAWFTGGAFGPEAGLSSIVALLIGFAVLSLLAARGAFARVPDNREIYARG